MHKNMTTMYKELVEYFCLDVKKTTMEEFFGDIKTFLDFFEVRVDDTLIVICCIVFKWQRKQLLLVGFQGGKVSNVKEKGANFEFTSSESLFLIGLLGYSSRRFDLQVVEYAQTNVWEKVNLHLSRVFTVRFFNWYLQFLVISIYVARLEWHVIGNWNITHVSINWDRVYLLWSLFACFEINRFRLTVCALFCWLTRLIGSIWLKFPNRGLAFSTIFV